MVWTKRILAVISICILVMGTITIRKMSAGGPDAPDGVYLLIWLPLIILSGSYLMIHYGFPRAMFHGGKSDPRTVTAVRESGPSFLTFRCGGRIGRASFDGPLLEVAVYPNGIWIKPVLMPEMAIEAKDLLWIRNRSRTIVLGPAFEPNKVRIRMRPQASEIEHKSDYVRKPLILHLMLKVCRGFASRVGTLALVRMRGFVCLLL